MSLKTAAKTLLAAVVISGALFSGVASARNEQVYTVRLAAPVAEATRVIADNALWNCQGDTCVARPNHGVSVRSCRQFVREAGAPVSAYGAEGRQLSADEISRCNAALDSQTLQAAN
ncbi:hypothetical protein U91I_04092 [alpha proteobacterium U9-1i]|nr:hypothetical protein U91I_04092 [alpha proteobacterium U9-1i]